MPLSSPKLRRFVRGALLGVAGDAPPSSAQLASSFDVLCQRLRARLHPLFGSTAVAALLERSVHLAILEFPWLADVVPNNGDRCSRDGLGRVAEQMERGAIEEALAAVLAHEIALLSTFIGEDFVMPLVQAAWETTLIGPAGIEGDHE